MLVLAIDPGLLSGFAVVSVDDIPYGEAHVVESGEYDFFGTLEHLRHYWTDFAPSEIHIVVENFLITAKTAKNSQSPFSLEVIGAVRGLLGPEYTVTRQLPASAKNFSTNDRLKRVGLWHKGGEGHANDAFRHALLYLSTRYNWQPPGLMAPE